MNGYKYSITIGDIPDMVNELIVAITMIANATHGDRSNVTNLWFLITDQIPDTYRNESLTSLIDGMKDQSKNETKYIITLCFLTKIFLTKAKQAKNLVLFHSFYSRKHIFHRFNEQLGRSSSVVFSSIKNRLCDGFTEHRLAIYSYDTLSTLGV